jgi:hypothetical protein
MVWGEDIWGIWVGYSRSFPALRVCKFFAAVQDKDGGVHSLVMAGLTRP